MNAAWTATIPSCQQFTSLRKFQTKPKNLFLTFKHIKRCEIASAQASGCLDILSRAETLNLPAAKLPLREGHIVGPEEWSQYPELLSGYVLSFLIICSGTNRFLSHPSYSSCSCEPRAAPLRVAVLLSGGVDSSLALRLLHAAGHHVTAYYLQIWFQEDFRNSWDACPWEEDLEYCKTVCAQLHVPLQVIPLTEEYWDRVVSHCINEVKAGRTPNPDVLCNSRVKFGAFLDHLEAVAAGQWDRIASGHYARIERDAPDGESRLALTPDPIKDQTYFLAHLTPKQLSKTLFPLGNLTKMQVRELAAAAALPNQARKDSQGICFLGKVRFSEFIKEHLGEWPGAIVEEETDRVIGYHRGFWFHTVGQRRGIQLSGGPWYVTRKNSHLNAVYVSRRVVLEEEAQMQRRSSFLCEQFSWTSSARPESGRALLCKVRHGPHFYQCDLNVRDNGLVEVILDSADQGLAAGQYAVFYQNGYCLGCAVISERNI